MPRPNEERSRTSIIDDVESYLDSFVEGPDRALERLGHRSDPDSLRLKLDILLNAGRTGQAAALAHANSLHQEWCEGAVRAWVLAEDFDAAWKAVEWARGNASRTVATRSAVILAREHLRCTLREHGAFNPATQGRLTDATRLLLTRIVGLLAPIISTIGQRIENQLESEAVQTAFLAHDSMGDRVETQRLAGILQSRTPLPLILAQAVLRRRIVAPLDLPKRLSDEYPDSFEANLLAVAIEGRINNRPGDAFIAAKKLARLAKSDEEQEQLAGVFIDLAHRLGEPERRDEAELLGESLFKSERYLKLLRADRALRQGALGAAAQILEESRDDRDPLWLQLQAKRLLHEGQGSAAALSLLSAAELLPDPEVLRTAAALAYEYGAATVAVLALERLIAIQPDDTTAHRNLAMMYVDGEEYILAASQFQELVALQVLDSTDRFNWALCLARAGDLPGSLEVLNGYSAPQRTPLAACLLRAEVLIGQGDPYAAFESIRQVRDQFWQEPAFLLTFLQLGFMSSNEREGNEAFVQIKLLQAQGRAREEVLKAVPVDGIVADINERREKQLELYGDMLRGRMSWLVLDMAFGGSPYWAWRIRTQELGWMQDDPNNRARFTLYSTNGFRVNTEEDGSARLDEIECPPRGTTVVADLSALISLHRLGLLAIAADYFGRILIPSAYVQNLINEAGHLLAHQPSRRRAAEQINAALRDGRISSAASEEALRVSEYEEEVEGSTPFRLRDLLDVLHEAGRLADERHRELFQLAHQPARGGLRPGQALVIQLATLHTLADFGLLGDLVQNFRVSLPPADREELESEVRAFEAQEEVRQWHVELWKIVRSDRRFVQSVETVPPELKNRGANPSTRLPLAAYLLARESGTPLFADDRVYQSVAINERPTDSYAGFGTDAFLRALCADETITAEHAADAFVQLLSWRYRFLVLPPEVLVTLAKRFAEHPPGRLLRKVALYIHDCMRDPGLLGGPEETDPPMSIADKLFMQWTACIAKFLAAVWLEEEWPEDRLQTLTTWAIKEFFPSVPRSSDRSRRRLDDVWKRHVLSQFLICAAKAPQSLRANSAVRVIAGNLGVSESEFLRIVSEVVDET